MTHRILNTTGGLYVCGDNRYGQLGLGHTNNINVLTKLDFFENKNLEIIDVCCGSYFTIIYTTDGLYVCGKNDCGQLGLSDGVDRLIPTKLGFFDNYEIKSISCGFRHTIINTNNGLYGFGSNQYGKLGFKNNWFYYSPERVVFFRRNKFGVISVHCGGEHTIVNTTDGLYVFGNNADGQLGLSRANAENVSVPTKLDFFNNFEIISISCGFYHTVVFTTDGLYVFGNNEDGQLGLNRANTENVSVPTKLDFFNNLEIIFISCGFFHTLVNTTSGLYVFGGGGHGRLGLDNNENIDIPTKLNFFNNLEILSISCGLICTMVNTTDGLFCFGGNKYGQLCLGDFENRYTPTKSNFNFKLITKNIHKRIKSANF